MDVGKTVIQNVRKWRRLNGFSQEKLAGLSGFTYSYIRQIECGRKCPSIQFIEKIAFALKIEPYQLFLKENEPVSGAQSYEEMRKRQAESELIETVSKNIHLAFEKI
ncbi:MAG: helix-turn-helix domain-containing protein [Spirochaetaceae bacterium]|jgi:transcriptional regulator with XRE-family HTH domain|nr:helix-turn-helix domain-containing protein [Spirochaetaceae bacterium]